WLERDLVVDFGAPEIMRVSLKGGPPEELISLLNAIREAYLEEAANREFTDKTNQLGWYRQVIAEDQGKLEKAQGAVGRMARELNVPDVATARLQYQNDVTQIANLRTLRFQLDVQRKGYVKAHEALVEAPIPAADPAQPAINPSELKAAIELAQA